MKLIPKGWLNYSNNGQQVFGTQFVPFKVPLKEELCRRLPLSQRFTPSDLLAVFPGIQLIIDLTQTDRYYNPQYFASKDIEYKKISCVGHGTLPTPDIIQKFIEIVDSFLASHSEDALIGVHCTHGLNRTGYLICKYMISRMNIDPKEAISRFQDARGHNIVRQLYIQKLMSENVERSKKTRIATKSSNSVQNSPEQSFRSTENFSRYVDNKRSNFVRNPSSVQSFRSTETSSRYVDNSSNFGQNSSSKQSYIEKISRYFDNSLDFGQNSSSTQSFQSNQKSLRCGRNNSSNFGPDSPSRQLFRSTKKSSEYVGNSSDFRRNPPPARSFRSTEKSSRYVNNPSNFGRNPPPARSFRSTEKPSRYVNSPSNFERNPPPKQSFRSTEKSSRYVDNSSNFEQNRPPARTFRCTDKSSRYVNNSANFHENLPSKQSSQSVENNYNSPLNDVYVQVHRKRRRGSNRYN